jgi:hypothetical protein
VQDKNESKRDFWVISQVVLAFVAIIFAIYIPYQIEASQRTLQNQANCTDALLSLRRDLTSFFDLGDDQMGNVLQYGNKVTGQADLKADTQEQARMLAVRRAAQNSRDTVYVLCREIGDAELSVDPAAEPWVESPTDVVEPWSRRNVNDILRQSSSLIDQIARVRPWPL